MRHSTLLFVLLFSFGQLPATECRVSGRVLFGIDEEPLSAYPVSFGLFSLGIFLEDTASQDGAFSFTFEVEFDGPNPIFGTLSATDFCTGEVLFEPVILLESFPAVEGASMVLCSDIDPPNPPANCLAYFQYQQAEVAPYIVQFFDISSTAAPIASWFWEFGDGGTSTSPEPTYEYSAPGEYQVSLTIQTDTCENTYSSWVHILDSLPCDCDGTNRPVCVTLPSGEVLSFLNECYAQCEGYTPADYELCPIYCNIDFDYIQTAVPGLVQFIDKSEIVGTEVTGWSWDFWDGNTSTQQNPLYYYGAGGMYDVSLQISTTGGCSGTTGLQIFVNGGSGSGAAQSCQAMFSFVQDESNPLSFAFVDRSVANADSWLWDFGDGNTSTERNPRHIYMEAGEYLVTLSTSNGDCTSTMGMDMPVDFNIVYDQECEALFMPIQMDASSFTFLNQSFTPGATFEWDLGDGNTSTDTSPRHTYLNADTYEVSLSMATEEGCTSMFSATIDPAAGTFTGHPSYSVVSSTDEPPVAEMAEIKAYPNPAREQLTLELDIIQEGQYDFLLRNANGQALRQFSQAMPTGRQQLDISLADIPPGLLFLQVRSEKMVKTLRMIRQ